MSDVMMMMVVVVVVTSAMERNQCYDNDGFDNGDSVWQVKIKIAQNNDT